tara:strand:+ start:1403 stop:2737 length:1335 start_codon:yes stop_codon:yes gene_type:complete
VRQLNDPIAAVATPAGRGALAILRISGSDLKRIAKNLFGKLPRPRVATLLTITGVDKAAIDNAVVIYFRGPHSFTGEDVIEIQTHGGAVAIREVMRAACAAGARQARGGEFSERAFINGKIDLIQAEAIADLIESSTTLTAGLAQKSLAGHFSRQVNSIIEKLKSIHVVIEAMIDFPEDEIPLVTSTDLATRSNEVGLAIKRLIHKSERGARVKDGLSIAIIGRPNVGKSTLLNVLSGEDRAIVTREPGTTRDILTVDIELDGLLVRLYDTAGLRETESDVEKEGVRRAKEKVCEADAIFFVVTSEMDDLDEYVGDLTIPVFKIRNKIDLDGLEVMLEPLASGAYLQISAKQERGIDLIYTALADYFNIVGEPDNMILARERHITELNAAAEALDFNHRELYQCSPELGAERIRVAMRALGTLTGKYTNEELLGEIFSTFCIGK